MTIASHALLLIVANGCLFVGGAGITRALGAWRRPRELRHALGTSFIAGLAAYGVAAELLYVLGFSLRLWEALALCAILAASGLLGGRRPMEARPPARPLARPEWVAIGLVVAILLLIGVDSVFQPLASWDAWTQWTAKARALVVMNGLDPHVLGNVVFGDWHLDYPPLVPALEAYAFRFMGIDYRVVHFEQWFLLFGFAFAYIELLRPRVRPLFMWAGLLAILWAPKVGYETLAANADLALAIFVGLAGIAAFIWITESSRVALGLLVLFGAAAMATKLEGTFLVAILFVLTLVATARGSRGGAWTTVAAGAISLIGIVPWKIWVAAHHLPATYSLRASLEGPGIHDRSRGPISTVIVLSELFSPTKWLLLIPLAVAAVATLARVGLSTRRARVLAAVTAAFIVTGVVTSLAVPGPSLHADWSHTDWLVFVLVFPAAVLLGATVARGGGLAAWSLLVTGAMTATFILAYVFTLYPFEWDLGTSSARVIVGPAIFLAALVPLLLEQAASRSSAHGSPDAPAG